MCSICGSSAQEGVDREEIAAVLEACRLTPRATLGRTLKFGVLAAVDLALADLPLRLGVPPRPDAVAVLSSMTMHLTRRLAFGSLAALLACTSPYGGVDTTSPPPTPQSDGGQPASCAADLTSDLANCGACGVACRGGPHTTSTCTRGSCGKACDQGFSDCDGDAMNGCEVELATNGQSCGRCGHDCLDGACLAGSCQPATVFTDMQSNGQLGGLGLDDNRVYFAVRSTNELLACPKRGLCPTPTVMAKDLREPGAVAVGATNIYWVEAGAGLSDGAVARCEKTGCGQRGVPMVQGIPLPRALAVDAVNVYFASGSGTNDFVKRCSLGGCGAGEPVTIASGLTRLPDALASNGQSILIALGGEVDRCPVSGCAGAPTPLAAGLRSAGHVIIDGAFGYWTDYDYGGVNGSVQRCPLTGCGAGPTVLAGPTSAPAGLAVDATDVYVAGPTVFRVPKTSATAVPVTAVAALRTGLVAVDGAAIYFTTTERPHKVMRLAK